MAKEPLNLTRQEQDILMDILLKEVNNIDNLNATVQSHLKQYRQEVLDVYKKVVANIDEE